MTFRMEDWEDAADLDSLDGGGSSLLQTPPSSVHEEDLLSPVSSGAVGVSSGIVIPPYVDGAVVLTPRAPGGRAGPAHGPTPRALLSYAAANAAASPTLGSMSSTDGFEDLGDGSDGNVSDAARHVLGALAAARGGDSDLGGHGDNGSLSGSSTSFDDDQHSSSNDSDPIMQQMMASRTPRARAATLDPKAVGRPTTPTTASPARKKRQFPTAEARRMKIQAIQNSLAKATPPDPLADAETAAAGADSSLLATKRKSTPRAELRAAMWGDSAPVKPSDAQKRSHIDHVLRSDLHLALSGASSAGSTARAQAAAARLPPDPGHSSHGSSSVTLTVSEDEVAVEAALDIGGIESDELLPTWQSAGSADSSVAASPQIVLGSSPGDSATASFPSSGMGALASTVTDGGTLETDADVADRLLTTIELALEQDALSGDTVPAYDTDRMVPESLPPFLRHLRTLLFSAAAVPGACAGGAALPVMQSLREQKAAKRLKMAGGRRGRSRASSVASAQQGQTNAGRVPPSASSTLSSAGAPPPSHRKYEVTLEKRLVILRECLASCELIIAGLVDDAPAAGKASRASRARRRSMTVDVGAKGRRLLDALEEEIEAAKRRLKLWRLYHGDPPIDEILHVDTEELVKSTRLLEHDIQVARSHLGFTNGIVSTIAPPTS